MLEAAPGFQNRNALLKASPCCSELFSGAAGHPSHKQRKASLFPHWPNLASTVNSEPTLHSTKPLCLLYLCKHLIMVLLLFQKALTSQTIPSYPFLIDKTRTKSWFLPLTVDRGEPAESLLKESSRSDALQPQTGLSPQDQTRGSLNTAAQNQQVLSKTTATK